MKKRCARFRHIALTRLVSARYRTGKSPYVFSIHNFRHTAEHCKEVK